MNLKPTQSTQRFQDIQGYIERHCLKHNKPNPNSNHNVTQLKVYTGNFYICVLVCFCFETTCSCVALAGLAWNICSFLIKNRQHGPVRWISGLGFWLRNLGNLSCQGRTQRQRRELAPGSYPLAARQAPAPHHIMHMCGDTLIN